ncbi:insulinase family protein [Flavobacterium agricola]|uniref:Insulinase family protein n=1 Tax=Flavobacterium agricola TaxID=2870839 RepID=A0ABY6LXV4_9FLAO|nr:pitrilysin family protein [Flavobacterium agricola]UYW00812.1 insulinase family protein [Flavobacterium agricola]
MKKYIFLAVGLLFNLSVIQAQDRSMPSPGPAPTVNVGKPVTFTLNNGLKVLIVENNKLPRVSYNLTIDVTPYTEGKTKGVSDMVGQMLGTGTRKMAKDEFNEEVDFLGAKVYFNSNGAYATSLSKYSDRVLELMADAVTNPVFRQEELDDNRNRAIEGLKAQEKNTSAIASRVENALTYGVNHPKGEFITAETLNNITLNDISVNYHTYFVPGNAYLVIVGDVDAKKMKKQVDKYFGKWKRAIAPNVSFAEPKNLQYTQINFVNVPNAVQSEIRVVNTVDLKYNDKDYFAVLLANQILGGGGEGRLFLNLREDKAWTYGAYSSVGAGRYTTKFRATTSVRNAVTDSAVVEILNELNKIRNEKVTKTELDLAKAKYIGNFVIQVQKPETVAGYALNTALNNLPDDYYENFIKNINAVTIDDVQRVAKKYFLADNARIVIAGKAQEVLPNLEKTAAKEKIAIFYFDAFGAKVDKPEVNREIPAGVTATSVLNDYLKAIGGTAKLKTVKTLLVADSGTIQGQPIEITTMYSADGKLNMITKSLGQVLSRQVFNGTTGAIIQGGQTIPMPEATIKELKGRPIFVEEQLLQAGAKLTALETLDNKDVYVVTLDNKTYYYDAQTKLKVAEKTEVEQNGQKIATMSYFTKYTDVKGIKFPFETDRELGPGFSIKLLTNSVQINEGVNQNDFKF